MKCYLDGNALCVVRDDFVNLQESDAVFVELNPVTLEVIRMMEKNETNPQDQP